MRCVVCKSGETGPGVTTVTLERGDATIVLKEVPAEVCENCGEEYLDAPTASRLLAEADRAVIAGVQLEVRTYRAA